jgi:tetratricopeptide (TPR) repeat protein
MTTEKHQQEIIELYLSRSKVTHKVQDRIELFQTLIDQAEKNSLPALAACFKGSLAWVNKDFDQSLSHFQEAIRLDESLSLAWNGLGIVHSKLKQYDKAKKCYEKAIELNNTYSYPWNSLGNLHSYLKQYDKAKECYEKALKLDETFAYPLNGLGNVCWALKQYDEAIDCYQKAIELDGTLAHSWNGQGNVYAILKEYDKAKDCFKKAIELDGTLASPWNGLGNVFVALKQYDKAIECYQKAIELDGSLAHPWNGLGNVYSGLKEYDKAKEHYEKAIELDPNEPQYQYNLGLLLFEPRKYSEAKEHLQIAEKAYQEKKEYKNEYWLSRTQDLLNEIKALQESEENLQKLEKEAVQDSKPLSPLQKILAETVDRKMAEEAERNQQAFLQFLDEPDDHGKDTPEDYLLVLRRWNSYTPIVTDNFHIGKGSGYFLKVNAKGIVIDPGFNFIDNFRAAGHLFHEIDVVLVSHAHNDHTADLESILTLLDKYNKEIKDSSDLNKKTIRRELAENKKVDPQDITQEEIDKAFFAPSSRRKIINFYLTASVNKKYGGLFDLFSTQDYSPHIVEPGFNKSLFGGVKAGGVKVHFLKAKHDDIISDRHSVGLYIEFADNLVLIYTGDTGWNDEIKRQYQKLGRVFSKRDRLLLAHLGGVKKKEQFYFTERDKAKVFYDNHLGRLGLALLNEVLQPQVCIISEFGEELREWRQDLADLYQDAFAPKASFISGDIGLKFMLKTRKIRAIENIDITNGTYSEADIDPKFVSSVLLRKDFSLHYINKNADFKKEDLVQILADLFDHSQYKPKRNKPKPEK